MRLITDAFGASLLSLCGWRSPWLAVADGLKVLGLNEPVPPDLLGGEPLRLD